MQIKLDVKINTQEKLGKLSEIVKSDELGTFAATEWLRLYQQYMPYTPASTSIEPWMITHSEPYARYDYYGNVMGPNVYMAKYDAWYSPKVPKTLTGARLVFAKGSDHWDEQAKPTEGPKLAEAIADYIVQRMSK